ncbi:MAG: hypothetical protein J7J98_03000 [candidate division Zixibacteria bacterium]|nr:hypothetical protein [candidate division Zixibacteria bacterium]
MKCKLCHEDKPLVKSHIIPEFCYSEAYDSLHRLNELSTDPEVADKCFRQKGVRQRLLCVDCEQLFSRAEKYFRETLYQELERRLPDVPPTLHLSSLDYCRLRMFQLSVLWRAAVSDTEFFENVTLPAQDEANIRAIILSEHMDEPHVYPCVMVGLLTGEPGVPTMDGFLLKPERLESMNTTRYRFIFGGYAWFYILTTDESSIAHPELIVTKDGRLTVPVKIAKDMEFFQRLGADINK